MAFESSSSGAVENGGDGGVVVEIPSVGSGVLSNGVVGCGTGFAGSGQAIYGGLDSASFERVFSDPVCKGSDFYAAVGAYYTAVGIVRAGGIQGVRGLEHLYAMVGSGSGISSDSGAHGEYDSGSIGEYGRDQGTVGKSDHCSVDNSSEMARGKPVAAGLVSIGGSSAGLARDTTLGKKDDSVGSSKKSCLTKTELNRLSRQKAKNRKARKKARQASAALSSVDWNADRAVGKSQRVSSDASGFGEGERYQGYFGSCSNDVRRQLVETRARRLTVENELRVAEMEQKMSIMRLQKESRLIERQFENDRMKLEIEAHKKFEQMPKGIVETVISSGTVSPNSSISLAAENKLRKDLAAATDKIAELTGGCDSGTDGNVLSPTERDLRLANFELESIRLRERSYEDYTFTDNDYKVALQSLRNEYADVLLTSEKRIAREAVGRVLDAFVGKIDEDMLERVAELGYIDGDTLID